MCSRPWEKLGILIQKCHHLDLLLLLQSLAYKADCFNLIWQLNEFINETETLQDAQLV